MRVMREQLVESASRLGMEILRRIDALAGVISEHGIAESRGERARVDELARGFASEISGLIEQFTTDSLREVAPQWSGTAAVWNELEQDYALRLMLVDHFVRGYVHAGGVLWALVQDLEDGPWDRASVHRSLRGRLLFVHERLERSVLSWTNMVEVRMRGPAMSEHTPLPLHSALTVEFEADGHDDMATEQSGPRVDSDYTFSDEADREVVLPPVIVPTDEPDLPPLSDEVPSTQDLEALAPLAAMGTQGPMDEPGASHTNDHRFDGEDEDVSDAETAEGFLSDFESERETFGFGDDAFGEDEPDDGFADLSGLRPRDEPSPPDDDLEALDDDGLEPLDDDGLEPLDDDGLEPLDELDDLDDPSASRDPLAALGAAPDDEDDEDDPFSSPAELTPRSADDLLDALSSVSTGLEGLPPAPEDSEELLSERAEPLELTEDAFEVLNTDDEIPLDAVRAIARSIREPEPELPDVGAMPASEPEEADPISYDGPFDVDEVDDADDDDTDVDGPPPPSDALDALYAGDVGREPDESDEEEPYSLADALVDDLLGEDDVDLLTAEDELPNGAPGLDDSLPPPDHDPEDDEVIEALGPDRSTPVPARRHEEPLFDSGDLGDDLGDDDSVDEVLEELAGALPAPSGAPLLEADEAPEDALLEADEAPEDEPIEAAEGPLESLDLFGDEDDDDPLSGGADDGLFGDDDDDDDVPGSGRDDDPRAAGPERDLFGDDDDAPLSEGADDDLFGDDDDDVLEAGSADDLNDDDDVLEAGSADDLTEDDDLLETGGEDTAVDRLGHLPLDAIEEPEDALRPTPMRDVSPDDEPTAIQRMPAMPTLQERFDDVCALAEEWDVKLSNLPEELDESWLGVLEERVAELVEKRRELRAAEEDRQERLEALLALAQQLKVKVKKVPQKPTDRWLDAMAAKLDEVRKKRGGVPAFRQAADMQTEELQSHRAAMPEPAMTVDSERQARVDALVEKAERLGIPLGRVPDQPTEAWVARTEAKLEEFLAKRKAERKAERDKKKRERDERIARIHREAAELGVDIGKVPPFPTDDWLNRADMRIAQTMLARGEERPVPPEPEPEPEPERAPQIVYEAGTLQEQRWIVARDMLIGRAPGSDIQLIFDGGVSRRHARIRVQGDSYLIEDAGSTKGTLLDGRKVESPTELVFGSVIQVGDTELHFDLIPIEL